MIATIQRIVTGSEPRRQRMDADERKVKWSTKRRTKPVSPPGKHLASFEPAQAAEVVDCADRCRDRSAEQQPARVTAKRQKCEGRYNRPKKSEPAEPRHRRTVHAPPTRRVDDAGIRAMRHRRSQQHDDDEGDERPQMTRIIRQTSGRRGCDPPPSRSPPPSMRTTLAPGI